jgi:hypothetical protein
MSATEFGALNFIMISSVTQKIFVHELDEQREKSVNAHDGIPLVLPTVRRNNKATSRRKTLGTETSGSPMILNIEPRLPLIRVGGLRAPGTSKVV